MDSTMVIAWIGFNVFVIAMLFVDLWVLGREEHEIKMKEALGWTAMWVSLALIFALLLWWWRGGHDALNYLTGYVIEYSLSMDNVFVFLIIFRFLGIQPHHQHKVLFWGILGAVVFRAAFIFAGAALLENFAWMFYVFGAFLIYTGIHSALASHEMRPEQNPVLKFAKRYLPVTEHEEGGDFIMKDGNGKRWVTPLLLALILIETTDIIFALDSIPAVLAITTDRFIAYSSNIFAVLGLRALYFAIAGLMRKLRFLHYGLGGVLAFVGLKMVLAGPGIGVHIPIGIALGVVVLILGVTVAASLYWTRGTIAGDSD